MATLTLSFTVFYVFEAGAFEYFVSGSGTSGNGSFANPYIVTAGDTVTFNAQNVAFPVAVQGLEIYTNNANVTVQTGSSESRTVTGSSLLKDEHQFGSNIFYVQRNASVTTDTTPDAFSFTDVTSAALSTTQTSNLITISGINASTAVSVSGGTYSKNGGTYTSTAGTCVNGDTFRVRHTSSASFSTATNTTLTVGGVSDTYTSTTLAQDTTPTQFTFNDVTGASRNTVYTSNTITIAGMNSTAAVSVTGGTYSKNGGAFVSTAGTAVNGDTFAVRMTSSTTFSSAKGCKLTVGGTNDTYTVTTEAADSTPDSFTFTDVSNASLSTVYESNTITVAGLNTSASVSITGGTFSKNGGAWTSTGTTCVNGDTFKVRHTSSASYVTATNTTLTIGGVADTFTTTTQADGTPNAFSFTDVSNAALSTTQTSNLITITGIATTVAVSVSGGTYSKNGGSYTSAAGTAVLNDTFRVRHTSSASYSTATNTTLTVGGISDTYTSTTLAPPNDTTPNAFSFTDVTGAALSTVYTSNTITISGINTSTSVSISGGTYSKNGGAYTSAAGTCVNGDTFAVRLTSSGSNSTATSATLTVGGVADTYTVTTLADTTPNAFTFTDVSNVATNTTQTSNLITISGITATVSVSVSGGTYSKNGGAYTSAAGNCVNGDTFRVRHTSSGSFSTAVNTTLTVGGVADTFTSTTLAADSTPNAFTFTDLVDQALSSTITSAPITVSGINTSAAISVTGGSYSINSTTAFTTSAGTVQNGDLVRARLTTSANYNTTVATTVTIGGVSDTFSAKTSAQDITPDVFSFTPASSVVAGSTQTSNTITVSGLGSAADVSVTGGLYKKNSGSFTDVNGTASNGDTFTLQGVAPSLAGQSQSVTLTIGTGQSSYVITTAGVASLYGLQSFDQSGNLKLTITDRSSFLLERATLTVPYPGSVTKTYTNNILTAIPISGYLFGGVLPYNVSFTVTNNQVTVTNNSGFSRTITVLVISGG